MAVLEANRVADSGGATLTVPPGTLIFHCANSAPSGFIKANGASLSTTTYATLFAAIGYTFGGSGGSFNVPNLRNRFAVGSESLYALGAAAGSADATLVSHTHGVGIDPSGTFRAFFVSRNRVAAFPANDAIDGTIRGGDFGDAGNSSIARGTLQTAGSSPTNANLPPYLALLACIKY
jgi:microcystin-dependent protein